MPLWFALGSDSAYSPDVPKVRGRVGPALARLRKRRRLTQKEVAALRGVEHTSVSSLESPAGNPESESIRAYLETLGYTWFDLAAALSEDANEIAETPAAYAIGQPRPDWVSMLVRQGFEVASLRALAMVLDRRDTQSDPDFIASAREAATELARMMLAEAAVVRSLSPAEPKP